MSVPETERQPAGKAEQRGFVGDVLTLTAGTVAGRAIGVLAMPVVARLFAPEAFGTAAVFAALLAILGILASLRYDLAIVLPETDREAASLLCGSLLIVAGFSLLTAVLCLSAGRPLCQWLGVPQLLPFLWLLPLAVLLNGASLPLRYWNTRRRRFGLLASVHVVKPAVLGGMRIAAGLLGNNGPGALVRALVTGEGVAAAWLGWAVWRRDRGAVRAGFDRSAMGAALRRYRRFPQFDAWSALLNKLSAQLPAFVLAAFFSPVFVGHYAMAFGVINMPTALVAAALSQAFYRRAAEARTEGNLAFVVEQVFRRLILFGLIPFLLLGAAGRDIFLVVFGERWAESGVYAQILAPWLFFVFVTSPLSTLLRVLEKQDRALYWNCALVVVRASALVAGGLWGNARIAVAAFSLSGVVLSGCYTQYVLRISGVSALCGVRALGRALPYALPGLAAILCLKAYGGKPVVVTAAAAALVIVCGGIVLLADPEIVRWLRARGRGAEGARDDGKE